MARTLGRWLPQLLRASAWWVAGLALSVLADPALAADTAGERAAALALAGDGRAAVVAAEAPAHRAAWVVGTTGWVAAMLSVVAVRLSGRRAAGRARDDLARVTRTRDRLAAALEDLANVNARLELANEQLERFAHVAAHDLRAPLRALMTLPGWVREEMSEAGVNPPGEVSALLDEMVDQAACMDRMLKDLLDYARLGGDEAGRTCIRPSERIREIARMAGMPEEFVLDIEPDLPDLHLAVVEFDTVMRNLLSNSVKHHDRTAGRITVRGWKTASTVVLEIEDDGPGIAAEHRERVFEIFSTLRGRGTAGEGMGLAFVRRIVQAWGGEVSIRGDGERGAVFRITIPDPHSLAEAA